MKDIIKGKSVAIVGRKPILGDMEQGEFIDSHDVVVRINSPLPTPYSGHDEGVWDQPRDTFVPNYSGKWHRCIGKRTTIFAPTNLEWSPIELIDKMYGVLLKDNCQRIFYYKIWNLDEAHTARNIDYVNSQFIPVYTMTVDAFLRIRNLLGYALPMLGTLVIYQISAFNPSSLYITGFGWPLGELTPDPDIYEPAKDMAWLRDLVQKNDHVTVDQDTHEMFTRLSG